MGTCKICRFTTAIPRIMMDTTFPLTAGLIASILHVIAGPDHLAAVAPFAIESKRKAWKIGLFLGYRTFGGHDCHRFAVRRIQGNYSS